MVSYYLVSFCCFAVEYLCLEHIDQNLKIKRIGL
jgi:hypothetical protein